ncbi:hypothetical protein [Salinibacter ruber]|jgi:hypothetical protein|uniref:hypothetical protein n=1 Tax=Salinibacter ruber TaxID=146919 RepID=UPI000E57FD71|nr:hypothetical protein [Salinibacter ruber]MCS3669247.1 hypothetical protein [Salinibacter ruber]MCS4178787.1 hypothetical protein [Salinibacter ruber]MCS4191898.1 hypothetical protein [Salinibacter ruber]
MTTDPDRLSPPGDEDIETTFRRLRRDGHSRLEALRLILDTLDVSLAEAKRLLMSNDTWAEARAETETGAPSPSGADAGDDPVPPAPA